MMGRIRSAFFRYALALACFALILLVAFGLPRVTTLKIDLTALIIIVMIASAWYLGRGPGLLIAILFELTLDYFSTAPLSLRSGFIIFNRLVLFASVVLFAGWRRETEKRLREEREWFKVTLSSIGDAVIATDVGGRVTLMNPKAEALTGWSMADAANRPIEEVFAVVNEETRQPVETISARIQRTGAVIGLGNHSTLIAKSKTEFQIEDSGAPIRDKYGKVTGVIIVFHDISERRRAELEREDLLSREQTARRQAEDHHRLRDDFLATVSHELRTPLSAIIGWSAMLQRGVLNTEETTQAVNAIERNANAQAEIIGNILDVSRIITGRLTIHAEPVALAPIVERAVESLGVAATAKSITLTVKLDPDVGLVAGDPERLQQVVWNLVSNAIKFTPKKGEVSIAVCQENSAVDLTVTDSGIGMTEQFLPYAFERFRQADSSSTRRFGGLGLGLAIVRHLVELHGGAVSATSGGEDQGSTFKVSLPVWVDGAVSDAGGVEHSSIDPPPETDLPDRVDKAKVPELHSSLESDNAQIKLSARERHSS